MFRKIFNITITCLLLVSTTGFTVSKHYCGEDLISVKMYGETESCCESDMCCHTEADISQLDEDFVYTTTELNFDYQSLLDIVQYPLVQFSYNPVVNVTIKRNIPFKFPPIPNMLTRLAGLQTFLL